MSRHIPNRPMGFLLAYVRARPWNFVSLAALVVGAGICAVAVQYGMKLIVDAMASGDRAKADVWTPLGFFIGLIAIESILWRLSGWLGARTIIATGVDMRVDLFEHLSGHPMRYFRQHLSGSLGNRVTATAGASGAIFSTMTWNIVPPVVDFIGAVVLLSFIDYRIALALVAFVAIVATIIIGFGVRGRPLHQAYGEQAAKVGGELVDTVSNVWAVKAFSARARERDRLARHFGIEARAQRRSWMHVEKARVMHDLCLWVMAGSMFTWALMSWQAGTVTPGDVVLISALTFRILHGSRDLALALVGTSQEIGIITEMLKVVGEPHGITDSPNAIRELPRLGEIEFQDVGFAYPDGHKIFEHFNLHIAPGEAVGLAGPSGGGKSTLLGLIQRMDDVQHGRILIDGRPITDYAQDALREAIAVVPQDISLFHRSVMENIRYGRPDATDDEVYAAALAAHCDGFIRRLSDGYGTVVGERGATLSGGQRQRLGIARAFLKNAPVLILDEATSALDTRSEREVQRALQTLVHGRTVIAVAHRLSTLQCMDRIVMLADGKVVEDAPPRELHRSGGLFSSLWDMEQQVANG